MHASTLLSAIYIASAVAHYMILEDGPITGSLGNATVTVDNPPGDVYIANLPETAFDKAAYPYGGNAKGRITAEAGLDGIGVYFHVDFQNLPETGGPFTYHIHASPMPADGNCTATGGHLDPFKRGNDPACNSTLKQTCQVGDLSGKHGKIASDSFNVTYLDLFTSTQPGNKAFFGNLSFVLHYPNMTRIACANFILQKPPYTPTTNSTTTVVPRPLFSSAASGAPKSSGTFSGAADPTLQVTFFSIGAALTLAAVVGLPL